MAETLPPSSLTPWPRERGGKGFPCLVGMLCREILEGFRKTGDPFAPAPFARPELGAGVLRKFAQSFGAQIFAQILAPEAPRIFLRRFGALIRSGPGKPNQRNVSS